jgi:hypothetical protein
VDAEATAAVLDAAVLRGKRTLVGLPDNLGTRSRTGLVRLRGGAGAEAASTSGLTHLAIFDGLRVKVSGTVGLRVVASGSAATSTVDYQLPLMAIDLPDGRQVQLDQAGRSFDFAIPSAGTEPPPGMPVLPTNVLPELLGALPGGPAALPALPDVLGKLNRDGARPADDHGVSPSAGSAQPPTVPGLPALAGVPAVGGLLGGTGRIATSANQNSLVLRLTGGEMSKEIADSGVHAKAVSLRVKLLLVRGAATTTLVDLGIGVLEVAATAPGRSGSGERGDRGSGSGGYGSGGDEPAGEEPTGSPSPSPTGKGGPQPTGGGGKLPVTGTGLTAVLGAGVVLLLAGRLLMVLARRRGTPLT